MWFKSEDKRKAEVISPLYYFVQDANDSFALVVGSRQMCIEDVCPLYKLLAEMGIEVSTHIYGKQIMFDIRKYDGSRGPFIAGQYFNFIFTGE